MNTAVSVGHEHISHSGAFTARAITRDVNSEKARALARLGAEVVAGDVDDEASLLRGFTGAHGAYCVTFFWAHFSPAREKTEAAAMARALARAKDSGRGGGSDPAPDDSQEGPGRAGDCTGGRGPRPWGPGRSSRWRCSRQLRPRHGRCA